MYISLGFVFFDLFFLFLPDKTSQIPDFGVFVLLKIIPMSFSVSYLQQIIVQRLLDDFYFNSSTLQFIMNNFSRLAWEACVELSPKCNFLDHFADSFLLLLRSTLVFVILRVCLPKFLLLLMDQHLYFSFQSSPEPQFTV